MYLVVGNWSSEVGIDSERVPEAGVDGKAHQAQHHEPKHQPACHAVQPVGVVLVPVVKLGGIKDDLESSPLGTKPFSAWWPCMHGLDTTKPLVDHNRATRLASHLVDEEAEQRR